MRHDLDGLMTGLAQDSADPRLAVLEPMVWSRIGRHAVVQPRAALGWQAAIAGLALGLGAVAGGAATAAPQEPMTLFSPAAALAPSTLLAGR
jgi:hypothetical protein